MLLKIKIILLIFIVTIFTYYPYASYGYYSNPEKILNFNSTIVVNRDASIDINEQITVFANQDKIKHGLLRFLPMRYTNSYGQTYFTIYDIKKILFKGNESDYHLDYKDNNLLIYIGSKDQYLPSGVYNYTIQYHVDDAISFFQDKDELYWNITGNYWEFPIEKAEATIILPNSAKATAYDAYTGRVGEKGKDFVVSVNPENQVTFVTTDPLSPGAGLTIAISFPKGIVAEPTKLQLFLKKLRENSGLLSFLFINIIVLIYYLRIWLQSPKKGTIIPLFEPPQNLSPGEMRYVNKMKADVKMLTAAIVSMAIKGYLTIAQNKNLVLKKINNDESQLSDDELSIQNGLFENSNIITLINDQPNTKIISALTLAKEKLNKNLGKQYFVDTSKYIWKGVLLSLLAPLLLIVFSPFTSKVSILIYIIVALLVIGIWKLYKRVKTKPILGKLILIIAFVFTVIIFLIAYGSLQKHLALAFSAAVSFPLIVDIILLIAINIFFANLLKIPTVSGRKLMDDIEGFKQYLYVAERYRLDQVKTKQGILELFEKYLPYAIALGIENQWGKKFNALLETINAPKTVYQPQWYSGSHFQNLQVLTLPSLLSQSMGQAFSSASSTSGSSSPGSASSGGGSSGGGRGGGGGGGW